MGRVSGVDKWLAFLSQWGRKSVKQALAEPHLLRMDANLMYFTKKLM